MKILTINRTKRMMVSRVVNIPRKVHFWGVTPSIGKHKKDESIALITVLRDYLHLGDKEREVTRIINSGKVRIDGKIVKERRYSVGFMDLIHINGLDVDYRVQYDTKGRLTLVKEKSERSGSKLVKIVGKKDEGAGKYLISFHDGQNILSENKDLKPGDVLLVSLPDKKIEQVLKLQPGNKVFLTGGSHVGKIATVKKIEVKESSHSNMLTLEEGFGTVVDYAFVIGNNKFQYEISEVEN
ncbi:MAG: 30S ribosomal protein S4e [Thermoplasmataceae archaeon]